MIRIVLDANQFVSAILVGAGNPARIMDAWQRGEVELLVSEDILAEVRRVLLYPRLRRLRGYGRRPSPPLGDVAGHSHRAPGGVRRVGISRACRELNVPTGRAAPCVASA